MEIAVNEPNLPLIDISQFPDEFRDNLQYHPEVAKLREACQEWGFFRIVNHGIPEDLLEKAQTVSKGLLSMPIEDKDRATDSYPLESYFRTPNFDTFCFLDLPNTDSIWEMCQKIWPEQGNSIFFETIEAYSLSVTALAQKITKAILASLGLDVETFYKSDFEKSKPYLRITGYSSHGKSIRELAASSHVDVGCLTVLYQDEKGGLEIRSKEGNWFSVKPLSNSLVVNVGDSLKAWSNDRYHSAQHQVVCNGWTDRMSIAFFYAFSNDKEIWAPEELVDEENPRHYKPFTFFDFKQQLRADKDKNTILQRFAGIQKIQELC